MHAPSSRRKIPIGVFDPAFPNLTLDQLVEKYQSMGVEAAEIGTGGYPNNKHCPMPELLDDPAKREAMGRAGRAAVEARYSWERVAEQMEEAYARLAR